jgi:c-di-GMP-binding flagellar brake protein YcgR
MINAAVAPYHVEAERHERRRCPRWALMSRIFYQLENDDTIRESKSVNISATGMCFTTPTLLQEDTRIKMKIFLSDVAVLRVSGLVIWSRSEDGRHMAAIRFSDIDAETQDLILSHAYERNKQDMTHYWFQGWSMK